MTEEKSLIVAEKLDMAVLFTKNGMDKILNEIETKAMAHVPDISTDQGRKDIASMAHKVARSKTLIDDMGKARIADAKKIVDEVNGYRKQARDFLDGVKSRVRQPLDEWEAEQAKIKAEEDRKQKEKIEARLLALSKVNCNLPFFDVAGMTDDEYEDILRKATEAWEMEQKRIYEESIARKAESERLERVRQEQAAEAALLAEIQRQADEANRKEREKIEAERRAIEAEKKVLEDAKRAEQERKEREAFEAKAKEEARIAAEFKAEAESARIKAEIKEKAEREAAEKALSEALKPEKEKLLSFADALMKAKNGLIPELKYQSPAYPILAECEHRIENAIEHLIARTEELK